MRLLKDDYDLEETLRECISLNSPAQLRQLFAMICVWSEPTDPKRLFEIFKKDLIEDFIYNNDSEENAINKCLMEFQKYFTTRQKKNSDFNLPEPLFTVEDQEEIDLVNEIQLAILHSQMLNEEQRNAVETILNSIQANESKANLFFIDRPGKQNLKIQNL
jgi:hypothetical protein